MPNKNNNDKIIFLFFGIIFVALLYLLKSILSPFLIAALLAYLFNPLVEFFIRRRFPRTLSVVFVFCIIFSMATILFLLLYPLIQKQIVELVNFIPNALTWFQKNILPWLVDKFGIDEETFNADSLKQALADNFTAASGAATSVAKTMVSSGMSLIETFTSLVLIPVVMFYLLRDWKIILNNIRDLLPRAIEPTIAKLAKESDAVISAFFRGQLLVMLSLGTIYSVGLMMMGLRIGLVIGFVSGLASVVPYLGFIVGIITASIAAYVQFNTFTAVLLVWLVFAIGQILESTVLTPQFVGDRIGLHPVAVIFAVLAGGSLFGFIGVLLALPVAAVMVVLLRFCHHHYRSSRLYQ